MRCITCKLGKVANRATNLTLGRFMRSLRVVEISYLGENYSIIIWLDQEPCAWCDWLAMRGWKPSRGS